MFQTDAGDAKSVGEQITNFLVLPKKKPLLEEGA